jgi:signal transduction histidine kinase
LIRRISQLSSKASLLHSVVGRVVAVTALGAAAIGATLALFFAANTKLRNANDESARAAAISAAAFDLRAQVVGLDNAFQNLIQTGSAKNIARWKRAQQAWKRPAIELERVAAGDPAEEQRAQALHTQIANYISDYGDLLIALAKVAPSVPRSADALSEGQFRIGRIQKATDGVTTLASETAAARSRDADKLARRATEAGFVALVLTPLLLVALSIWLARSVARPLQRTVDAASSVAAGDFDVRLNERRRDEFGILGRAFNAMTVALARNREELITRAESLEVAERHRSELISMVSHEVRTPLASILGFTRLLLERDLDDHDRRRYLKIIDAEATRLASLVSDFLDARLIEEGKFALRRELFDIRSLVLEQAELVLAHDETHDLDLKIREKPLFVQADRSRLTQVVSNILSNAVKYSPSGGTITVGAAESDGSARIWVDDEGTGIAPEFREQIFEPFYRGGAPAKGIPGTGLGLAVSRRIVEAHGGRIGFDALPAGTRFWIEVPVEEPFPTRRLDEQAVTS